MEKEENFHVDPARVKEAEALWEDWDEERRAGFLGACFRRCGSVHGNASGGFGVIGVIILFWKRGNGKSFLFNFIVPFAIIIADIFLRYKNF